MAATFEYAAVTLVEVEQFKVLLVTHRATLQRVDTLFILGSRCLFVLLDELVDHWLIDGEVN